MNTDRIYLVLVPLLRRSVVRRARRRQEAFQAEPSSPGRVVFLGDSITQRGDWEALFPELATLNRGIDGDTTQDVLARLDGAIDRPLAVNLLIGTNDLHTDKELKDPAGIVARLERIIAGIHGRAPGAMVFVNSMMPRTAFFAPRIRALNERFRDVAERTGCVYVDLWPALADDAGALRKQYTFDNLHLSPAGYDAWSEVLRPVLAPFARTATTEKDN